MRRDAFILFSGDAEWLITRVRAGSVEQRRVAHEEAATALGALGHAGQGVLLGVPSHWCLAASISLEGLGGSDRRAMLYRLEEKLPLAAEELVADFVPADDGGSALGIAARVERLRPAVEMLETAGVQVEIITPVAMLVAQGLAVDGVLLVAEEQVVNVIRLERGRPGCWSLVAEQAGDVRLELTAVDAQNARALGIPHQLLSGLGRDVEQMEGQPLDVAVQTAARLLDGQEAPWVNLRRDALAAGDRLRAYRAALNAALAAAAVFLLALTAAALLRGQRYESQAAEHERRVGELFSAHFPGWEVPADVRGVVESEHRKAMAHSPEALPADARGSALLSFRDVLRGVAGTDAAARYRIDRMRFTESAFELDGAARSPQDVQPLVSAAKAAGMEVELPQTRRDDGGVWVFSIRGSRAGAGGDMAQGVDW
jgi:type II secretion system protein L